MGEYAKANGEEVKIGTCENMYYLRYDQRAKVHALPGSVNPVRDAGALRFRFPWPDEDHVAPGGAEFGDNGHHRSIAVDGYTAQDVEHFSVQFTAHAGYLTSLPCPESKEYTDARGGRVTATGLHVHRNGFSGAVQLVAQRWIEGVGLVPVMRCGGCGAMWREEEPARIKELAVCFRSMADVAARRDGNRPPDARRDFWHKIADRVLGESPSAAKGVA